jgi:hypothetical protein
MFNTQFSMLNFHFFFDRQELQDARHCEGISPKQSRNEKGRHCEDVSPKQSRYVVCEILFRLLRLARNDGMKKVVIMIRQNRRNNLVLKFEIASLRSQ